MFVEAQEASVLRLHASIEHLISTMSYRCIRNTSQESPVKKHVMRTSDLTAQSSCVAQNARSTMQVSPRTVFLAVL